MRIVTLLILLLLSGPALAAKNFPNSQDGPAGCGWRATVIDTHPGGDFVIDLSLLQMVGKCAYDPGPCGAKGDHVSVTLKKSDIQSYHVGQIVKVWVTGNEAKLEIPACIQTPG